MGAAFNARIVAYTSDSGTVHTVPFVPMAEAVTGQRVPGGPGIEWSSAMIEAEQAIRSDTPITALKTLELAFSRLSSPEGEIAKKFVALGVDTIRLTGGEPLVRKNVDYLLRELAKLPVKLKMTTNGVLLDKYFDLFGTIGLKDINVSLDTLDKSRALFITKRDYYERVMKNVEEAIKRKLNIKLNVVLIKGVNDHEITHFIDFTRDKNITVKFTEFMPFKDNQWDAEKCVGEEEILSIVRKSHPIKKLEDPKHSTSSNYQVDGYQVTIQL